MVYLQSINKYDPVMPDADSEKAGGRVFMIQPHKIELMQATAS
ncbi:MAG: hypothetical protein SOR92_12195 [Christensenella hongkongensis]|uniref:Uncharacterized protein n=1 Tax=Christensenella hongkongensis TaxID=270498 RepID=A0A0M2NKZ5_9FIRM|nr:hypothetical protein [Christensenella hongkongensis]KKI50920.1 hypothetical protein CHK_1307 [Christensenella hongkongensis]MDY3005219.1 hypothetical protein [Christensenella hongkongensis]